MQISTLLATLLLTTNPDLCGDVYLDDDGEWSWETRAPRGEWFWESRPGRAEKSWEPTDSKECTTGGGYVTFCDDGAQNADGTVDCFD